jgi:hypothetical protein
VRRLRVAQAKLRSEEEVTSGCELWRSYKAVYKRRSELDWIRVHWGEWRSESGGFGGLKPSTRSEGSGVGGKWSTI